MRFNLALLLLTLMVACAPSAEETQLTEAAAAHEDEAAITALWDKYDAAVESGDVEAVLAIHTDDSVRMPPNEPTIIGKEGIRSWYQRTFDEATIELEISQEEIEVLGDWAFERGTFAATFTPKEEGEPANDNGKFVIMSQRQADGSWKRARAIWSSDNPPAGGGS